MRPSRNTSAFSLVEVVLALGVASFTLTAILGLLSVGLNSSKASTDNTLIAAMANNVVNDLQRQQFADQNHPEGTSNVLPGTADVTAGNTPQQVTPSPKIYFDVSGTRLIYTSGSNCGADMSRTDALASGAVYQCTEILQGDAATLGAVGTNGSSTQRTVNILNVKLQFTWPVQAVVPPNSETIYATVARY